MQTITPVDIHTENDWRDEYPSGSYVKKSSSTVNRGGRQAPRMRTCVISKTKSTKGKSSNVSSEINQSKQISSGHSRSPSPNREPWVPPPGRTTKGQKLAWQNSKARHESNFLGDNDNQNIDNCRSETLNHPPEHNEKILTEIQTYEKRIQGLIESVETLKERVRSRLSYEQIDQLRSDIDTTIHDLEQSPKLSNRTPVDKFSTRFSPPSRISYRSASADDQRIYRSLPKVSFENDSPKEGRRARSTTPVRSPLHLNPNREQLLISLSKSEADIAQITKQLSSVKDILTKLKFDDHPVSYEVEQLYQQRNQLLHLIEQFEYSNGKLKDFLRHHYHLEVEHGVLNDKTDRTVTHNSDLENENKQIRRLLLDRENDNIALQTELDRIKTHALGYDTMKTSLEQNRAHLQRELYAKEGEINRLQCNLRSLERDLQRNRCQCDNLQRSIKRTPSLPMSSYPSLPNLVAKTKGITSEKFQAQLSERDRRIEELEKLLYGNKNEQMVDANSEIIRLRTKLEHCERLVTEYKEQLHNHNVKTTIKNSKTHLSEVELEKLRVRLQKRIEELEPLPELLRQAEMKNQDLQIRLREQEKHLADQSTFINELNSKTNIHNHIIDRMKDNHYPFDDDHSTSQHKIDNLQRRLLTMEEDNAALSRNLNAKEETLRNMQARFTAKSHELTTISKQIDATQTDLKTREDTYGSKERSFQQRINDFEQQISRLRLDHTQLKREKEESERRYTSQLGELRDKLEQSNNNNRSIQNYVNSLKTTYATVFNDALPPSLSATSFPRFTSTPSVFP